MSGIAPHLQLAQNYTTTTTCLNRVVGDTKCAKPLHHALLPVRHHKWPDRTRAGPTVTPTHSTDRWSKHLGPKSATELGWDPGLPPQRSPLSPLRLQPLSSQQRCTRSGEHKTAWKPRPSPRLPGSSHRRSQLSQARLRGPDDSANSPLRPAPPPEDRSAQAAHRPPALPPACPPTTRTHSPVPPSTWTWWGKSCTRAPPCWSRPLHSPRKAQALLPLPARGHN